MLYLCVEVQMNKNLSEAIRKQKIRRIHRNVIKKSRLLEQHTLYSTFVQPFADVVQAVGLVGQDILNAAKLQLDLAFTLSPKKMEEAHQKFDERKAKIGEKWAPIMERTDEALANSDLNLFAMVMAPEIFLASEALAAGYKAADSMGQYLADAGFKIPFASAILGYEPESSSSASSASDDQSLLGKITALFGIESAWHDGPLIVEQESKDSAPQKEPDFKKAMKKYLEETGLARQFEQDAKELLEVQKEFVQAILDEALPRLTLLETLSSTADVDEFISSIENAKNEGVDLQAAGLDNIKQGVEEAAQKLAESDDFKVQVAEEAKKSVEDLSDAELEKAAKNVAFVNAKKEFDSQVTEGKEELKQAALTELDKNTPSQENLSAMRASSVGQEFIKLMEEAKQRVQNV